MLLYHEWDLSLPPVGAAISYPLSSLGFSVLTLHQIQKATFDPLMAETRDRKWSA